MGNNTWISFYLKSATIRIHRSTIRKMGNPKFLRMLISEDNTSLAVQAYHEMGLSSFRVLLQPDQVGDGTDIHSKDFCDAIAKMLGWEPNQSYRILGQMFPMQHIAVFDLTEAKAIGLSDKKK